MKTPTFREQYDKIVGAYLRNELRPLDSCACFIGNLLNGTRGWCFIRKPGGFGQGFVLNVGDYTWGFDQAVESLQIESKGLYTPDEIIYLENLFLAVPGIQYDENLLFEAMERTLLALKKLHESKGEVIEDYVFEKRQLINA